MQHRDLQKMFSLFLLRLMVHTSYQNLRNEVFNFEKEYFENVETVAYLDIINLYLERTTPQTAETETRACSRSWWD